ncbi:MAG: EAL domain-containing protein [Actinobacteria bacterium]|nr:EAL domain-containing protein [Actinomycetota bacterium]
MTNTPHEPDREQLRRHAQATVRGALDRAGERRRLLAVLLVDASDVSRVDQAAAHATGDRALAALEQRVRDCAPAGSAVVRLTRERLVVVAEQLDDRPDAVELAQALATRVREPLRLEQLTLRLDATVGLALAPEGRGTASALLRDADAAARQAHAAGERAWRLADAASHERAMRRLRLEDELATALAHDQLALYFQPIVSLRRGTLVGIEALVRWRHPERGLLGPAQFLPVAEESGLIVEIGDWMLAAVCTQVGSWSTRHPERVLPPVSLNVSARELRDERFAQRFTSALAGAQIPPESLALEVTDPGVVDERADVEEALEALRRLGVRILLDRFGGARSSLAHLAQLPIDGLKLDGSLLRAHGASPGERAIAEAIVGLAHALGLSITAPGIETQEQLAVVRSLEVDAAQGHLLARPAPASTLADLQDLELELAGGGGAAGGGAPEPSDELLPLSAVADALGVSPSTVRRLADQGVLPGTRTGGGHRRFRRADVQRLARERSRGPALRPWELPAHPLPASAELLAHDGSALVERAARALYDPQQPGWFAAPQGLARGRMWLAGLGGALAAGKAREGLTATSAYADAAALGGASAAEVVRFLGQFAAVVSHELVRAGGGPEEARGLQRIMSAATDAFLEKR